MSLTTMCALCYGVLGPLEDIPGAATFSCNYCMRPLSSEEQKEAHIIEQTALGPRTYNQHMELVQGIFAALQKVVPNADRLEVGVYEGVPWNALSRGPLPAVRELWEALERAIGVLAAADLLLDKAGDQEAREDLRGALEHLTAVLDRHRMTARLQ